MRDIYGAKYTFNLRRLKCDKCNKQHEEIPDIIQPHKQYSRDTIKTAINESCDFYTMEESTVFRWRKENTPTLQ